MVAWKKAFSSAGIKCLVLGEVMVKAHKMRFAFNYTPLEQVFQA